MGFRIWVLVVEPGLSICRTTRCNTQRISAIIFDAINPSSGHSRRPRFGLALDVKDQAVCDGVAFLVAPEHQADTLEYLRERELISSAYVEKILMIDVKDIGRVESVVYVIDETHDQYCDLSLREQANIIAHAVGGRGPNWEYLRNTVNFLNDSQIYDADLQWLEAEVTKIRGQ